MAAPSGIVWGSQVVGATNNGGCLGIYTNVTSNNTTTTLKVEVWFWGKWTIDDLGNTFYYDNLASAGSAKTDRGNLRIKTTDADTSWSTANQIKIASYETSYTRGTADVKRYLYAKLINIDVVGSPMTVSATATIPKLDSYTIQYNANGGTGAPGSQTKWYGKALTLSDVKPSKTGHTFKGWALTKEAADNGTWYYQPGSSCGRNENTTLYAVWQANTYEVKYNANGGTGAPGSQTKTYGVALTLSGTKPTRANYTFKGWAETASATSAAYSAGGAYSKNASVTLYAVWELNYVKPRITRLAINRCLDDGTPSDDGTYASVRFDWACDREVSDIAIQWGDSSGSANIEASGTSGTVSSVVGGSFDAEKLYTITVSVRDSVDYSHAKGTLHGKKFPIDVLAGGNGVAIGKAAEHDGLFDCAFPARFTEGINGSLRVNKGGTTNFPDLLFKAYNRGTSVDCNDFKTSGFYGIYGSCSNGPKSNLDIGILVVVAYSDDWVYQEFVVPATNGLVLKYFRTFYMGTTWTEWKKSMHHSYPVAPKIAGDGNYSFKMGVMNNPELVWVYQSGGSTDGSKWFAPVTDAAVLLGASSYRWGQIYSTTSSISTSDRNQKKDFTEFDKRYEELFAKLKPQLFKFKDGTSDRKHSGFISQDVEEAMLEVGLTDKEFAGFCKDIKQTKTGENEETGEVLFEDVRDENGNLVYNYSLRYEEFIALNTYMIQKQQSEIEALKNEIRELKDLYSKIVPQSEGAENGGND